MALFVLGALTLFLLVPKDKIIARVVPALESAVGRTVHLSDAGISLWPPFGVYLTQLQVENQGEGATSDLLSVERLRAQLAWQPLLSGELRFSSVFVEGLAFHYEQQDDSTSNVSDLLSGEGGIWPVLVEDLEFENLLVSVSDRRDTSAWSVEGVGLSLRLDPVRLDFECAVSVPQIRMRQAAKETLYQGPLDFAIEGSLQRHPPTLMLSEIRGILRDLPLEGAALLRSQPRGASIDGHLTIGPVAAKQVLAYLPEERRAALSRFDISGDLQLSAVALGPLDSLASGAAQFEIGWTQGRIADSLGALLSFSELEIPVDHAGFHLDALPLVSRYGTLRVAAVGSWPPEGRLELSVSGRTDLAALVTQTTGTTSGIVEWSASASGPMTQPALWRLLARAQMRGARFEEARREPFEVGSAEVSYDGSELRLEHLRASFGRSDLELAGDLRGFSWADCMADRPLSPVATLSLRSRRLDLDQMFPQLAGDSLAPEDTSARPPWPPLQMSLSTDIDTLMLGGALWRRMHGEFSLADGHCTIDTLYGAVYGGKVHLAGRIDSLSQDFAPYEFRMRGDSLEIGELLGRFGAAGHHLRGRSDLAAKVSGRGALTGEGVPRLVMDGSVHLFDTRLENLAAAQKIQELLGMHVQDPLPIKSVSNRFRFEGGRARLDDFHFTSPQGAWILGGTAGLDGTLDYALSGLLPPEVASHLKLPESWLSALPADWQGRVDPLDLLKNDDGAIDLFFKIGGTLRSPQVAVDWEKLQPLLQERFESRLKEKVSLEVQKQLKEGLKGLLDKLKH